VQQLVQLVAAVGLATLIERLGPRKTRLLVPALLLLSLALNVRLYFFERPVRHDVWQGMYPVDTAMGAFVREQARSAPGLRVFVPRSTMEESVLPYLAYHIPVRTFEGPLLSKPWAPGDWFLVPTAGRDSRSAAEPLAATARAGRIPFPAPDRASGLSGFRAMRNVE
jgi:hypothetical protein